MQQTITKRRLFHESLRSPHKESGKNDLCNKSQKIQFFQEEISVTGGVESYSCHQNKYQLRASNNKNSYGKFY